MEERGNDMNKATYLGWIVFAWIAVSAAGQEIKEPVWAGKFYSSDPRELAESIGQFLRGVDSKPGIAGDIRALVIPHAGYEYSGRTAAFAYALIQGRAYDAVAVIGPSHRYGFRGISVYPKGGLKTPLGIASVDEALAAEISKRAGARFLPEAFEAEHSVEVQIPFLQITLPGVKIVPIIMGFPDGRTVQVLAEALAAAGAGKKILVIASSDMSHFLSKPEANATDAGTIDLIRELKADKILKRMQAGDNILCGGGPVAVAIRYAQALGGVRAELLKYSDSADTGGDTSRVVGYGAIALASEETPAAPDFKLSGAEKKDLLKLARSAVSSYVLDNKILEKIPRTPGFDTKRGVFVTLKIGGRLRGCIGFIEPVLPLAQAVVQAAVHAASQDPRFNPVTREELSRLEYEISVLTPLMEVKNPSSIRVGRHGLVVAMDGRSGLLLPQVATENGWDRETFLRQTCFKAGLAPDAWKKGARIFSFEAIVFR